MSDRYHEQQDAFTAPTSQEYGVSSSENGILMEKVCYSIGGRKILEDFDLHLEKGVNRTILGVSGVGKTTILKLLLGLLSPDSGRILINGVPLAGLSETELSRIRKPIAIVFQGGPCSTP